MGIVPKGPRANVRDMEAARAKRDVGGRPSGLGYDPATGDEVATPTLERRQREASPEVDVFALVGTRGYSEARFYTKSTDGKGHGEHLRVRVPQGIEAQVYGAARDVPEYRSVQDFVRDAIVHRLEYLQKRYKMSDEGRRLLELERLRADSDRRATDIEMMTETVRDLGEKLTNAWDAKDYGMFAQELDEADELIDWLREPYKAQLADIVNNWKIRGRAELERVQRQRDE